MPTHLDEKISCLAQLSYQIANKPQQLSPFIEKACRQNPWFTHNNVAYALNAIATEFLDEAKLKTFLQEYPDELAKQAKNAPKKVGIIMAGNLPLVGFHDFLCVYLSGHHAAIKLSSKDDVLLPAVLNLLSNLDANLSQTISFPDKLTDINAIIATGSNNTARYFEYYFGKYPHIIRQSRVSAAIITGHETTEELKALGDDVFRYFGMGCRNVAKLFVPKNYDLTRILTAWDDWQFVENHNKYKNNYDYYCAMMLLNREPHLANSFVALVERPELAAPTGLVYYEYYDTTDTLTNRLIDVHEQLQCVVGNPQRSGLCVPFGHTQLPALNDYADKIDTMQFLLSDLVCN